MEMGPDALIMSDPGLIMMVRERWPQVPIHLSVQSNVVNYAAVEILARHRAPIILSRELSLKEIAQIRERCPDIELEVFVHGALCMHIPDAACCPVTLPIVTPTRSMHQYLPLEIQRL